MATTNPITNPAFPNLCYCTDVTAYPGICDFCVRELLAEAGPEGPQGHGPHTELVSGCCGAQMDEEEMDEESLSGRCPACHDGCTVDLQVVAA